jgi:branched-chain amino acid transport system ATP-binding protein
MSKPQILLLDEPSLGLAPIVIDNMFKTIRRLNREFRLTTLIVEQNATMALEMCDRAYVLETGKICMEGRGSDLLHDGRVMKSYPGITK